MFRNLWIVGALVAAAATAPAQERRSRIDVEHYTINAEINENTQTLAAKVGVQFVPLDNNITTATFELNNALNVSRVVDDSGRQVPASRSQQDFTVRLNFEQPLVKGKPTAVTFEYEGRFTGQEDSPVYGVRFAAIHPDYAFLMYPARWFPISGYTTDRYTADMNITVAAGNRVVASGLETSRTEGDKAVYSFQFKQPSFPGSIAVVRGDPTRVNSEGVTTNLYFRGAQQPMANVYGQEIGKVMTYFTAILGLPPYANLAVVETDDGAPNGFSAPGVLFLSPRGIGRDVNAKLLANQVSRQWWHALISPATRNHLWLTNGFAAYSELLYTEHTNGPGAMDTQFQNVAVNALTVDNVPVIQASRLEDYSPELWALTGDKGAAVLNMLRSVLGDQKFFEALKKYVSDYPWKSTTTEDFRKVVEAVSQQNLGYFFIEWIESSGAPEFKLDYTIFRTQKGFRVMGKVSQDLDTFRMPVDLKIETEGNPEDKRVEVVGTSSEFSVDTFGKPKTVVIDPNKRLLRYSNAMRVAVAIRRGEQFAEVSEFGEALKEYQKALETNKNSSLAHYRIAEVFFLQNNYQSAANEFREALNGDLDPKWTEVWAHINLGKIFDITGQRDRAVNEYQLAQRTRDNTQGAQDEAAKYLKKPYERQRSSDALAEK
ncbi:MAG TPA: M1 family aminopeptidase [Bryobacteraceae bacterium]|nr:M1 family aminopeptidase [Bryobacteraceae bacterium]